MSDKNTYGKSGGYTKVFPLTAFTCDTSAYASGDLLTDPLEFDLAVREDDGEGILFGLNLLDKADQGVEMTIYVLKANTSFGTKNSAPSITDTNAENILGKIKILSSDWDDLGGCRSAYVTKSIGIKAGTATKKIWLVAVNGTGAPTFGASDLMAAPHIVQD